jgi:hypothetical protein
MAVAKAARVRDAIGGALTASTVLASIGVGVGSIGANLPGDTISLDTQMAARPMQDRREGATGV